MPQADRETFSLIFPSDLTLRDATRALQTLHGIATTGMARMCGVSSVVLEVVASPAGLSHRLRVDSRHATYVTNQLRTHLPGVRVEPMHLSADETWTSVVELGMRQPDHPLQACDPERVAATLLTVLEQRGGSATLMQLVLSPAPHERSPARRSPNARRRSGFWLVTTESDVEPSDLAARREKLSSPNYLAVIRIGIRADSPARAQAALSVLRTAFNSMTTTANGIYARQAPQSWLQRRIAEACTPLVFPMQLSVNEALAIAAWPIASPLVAGLPRARTRHLPPSGAIPSRGIPLATATFPGAERTLAIAPIELTKHCLITGPTGVGKTTLLSTLARSVMLQGFGLVIVETKGQFFRSALGVLPKKRLGDVVIMDVSEEAFPVGFNILAEGNPRTTVEYLCQLFEQLYQDTRSVWVREVLYHALSTLITQRHYTFPDLVPLLMPMKPAEEAWRNELIDSLTDPELCAFWERFRALPRAAQDRMVAPVLDRVWQLNARPDIRNIIGQSTSSFTMSEVVAKGKILMVNLSGLGSTTAALLGTLIVGSLWKAVQATAHRRPMYVLLDEFQDFANLGSDPAELFVKAREYGLGIVAAHQHLGQLSPDLRQAVLANTNSKIMFRAAADDARAFAREFGRPVTDADLLNLSRYEIICSIATRQGVSPPVTAITKPPPRQTGLSLEARTLSRERYGRSLNAVAFEIAQRRAPLSRSERARPRLGGEAWE